MVKFYVLEQIHTHLRAHIQPIHSGGMGEDECEREGESEDKGRGE